MGYQLNDSVKLLAGGNTDPKTLQHVHVVLEDSSSPLTSKYKEKLFQSIIDKGHIDFGDIEKSEGDIKSYNGYQSMMDCLKTINDLATDQKVPEAVRLSNIVLEAIGNIEGLRSQYQKGFRENCDYVKLEYNTYVYTCVEATTTLIGEFADYIKIPTMGTMQIRLQNTKLRANEFYFEQLTKFNSVNKSMGINYRKMLETICTKEKDNFVGIETLVGISAISAVLVLIVPVTRALIYRIYNARNKIADSFDMQAKFLEMNKLAVESNVSFTADKRKEIVGKQEKLAQQLKVMASKIRVNNVKSQRSTDAEIKKYNNLLTLNSLQDSANSDPLVLV